MKLRMLIVTVSVLLTLLVPSSAGQVATLVPLPADLQGELDGVPYRIRVPANWNGTLLVYSYGYAEAFTPTPLAPLPSDEDTLLTRGFALAVSRAAGAVPIPGLATDAGWNFKERMQNTAALTAAFHGLVGRPQRTITWGKSMGGLVSLGLIEKFPGLFDGAVALCPPDAGAPRSFDQKLDITLAYAVAFGWDDAWGTPGELRPDLNFITEVYPRVLQQAGLPFRGRWEFLRLVNRLPIDTFYAPTNYRIVALAMAFITRLDLDKRAGGHATENIGRLYTLTNDEKTYLEGLDVDVDVDALLAQMNAMTTFKSDRNARNYVAHYFNPSGVINRPVITLHTTGDALAPPNNECAYRATVEQQGNGDLLMQQFVPGGSHCTFTSAQYLAAIDAMMNWLDTGNRPDPSVYFPAALGFVPGYVPPPWPW